MTFKKINHLNITLQKHLIRRLQTKKKKTSIDITVYVRMRLLSSEWSVIEPLSIEPYLAEQQA